MTSYPDQCFPYWLHSCHLRVRHTRCLSPKSRKPNTQISRLDVPTRTVYFHLDLYLTKLSRFVLYCVSLCKLSQYPILSDIHPKSDSIRSNPKQQHPILLLRCVVVLMPFSPIFFKTRSVHLYIAASGLALKGVAERARGFSTGGWGDRSPSGLYGCESTDRLV